MNCSQHRDVTATRSCHACLSPLCETCTQEVLGAFYCQECLEERLRPTEAPPRPTPPPLKPKRIKIPFVSGLLSVLPGLGQVYNGLLARALSQFVGFLLLTGSVEQLVLSGSMEALMAIAIIVYYIWQVIDAVRTAKDINAFGRVPDPEEAEAMGRGAIPGMDRGSKGIGIALMVVGGVLLLGNLGFSRMLSHAIEALWPFALLLGGIYLVRRSRQERRAFRPLRPGPAATDDALGLAAGGPELRR